MLAWESSSAAEIASAMELVPIPGFLDPDLTPMCAALERKLIPDASRLTCGHFELLIPVHNVDNGSPRPTLTCQQLRVPEDIETTFGPRERDTGSIFRREETNLVQFGGPNEAGGALGTTC